MPLNKNGFLGSEINKWSKNNIAQHKDLFELANQINQFSYSLFQSVGIESNNQQKKIVWLLFLRASKIFQSIIILLEKGMIAEARILLRSLSEVLFKLVSCVKNEENVEKYIVEWEKIKEKLYNKLEKHPEYVNNQIRIVGQELKNKNKSANIKERTIEEIAKEADLSDFYNLIYPSLNSSAHIDINELSDEHIKTNEEGYTWMVIEPHNQKLFLTLSTAITIILIMLKNINSILQLGIEANINEFGEIYTNTETNFKST